MSYPVSRVSIYYHETNAFQNSTLISEIQGNEIAASDYPRFPSFGKPVRSLQKQGPPQLFSIYWAAFLCARASFAFSEVTMEVGTVILFSTVSPLIAFTALTTT